MVHRKDRCLYGAGSGLVARQPQRRRFNRLQDYSIVSTRILVDRKRLSMNLPNLTASHMLFEHDIDFVVVSG